MRSIKETSSEGRVFIKRNSSEEQHMRVRAFSISDWEEDASVRCWKRVMDIIFSVKWKVFILLTVFCTIYSVMLRIVTTPSTWDQDFAGLDIAVHMFSVFYLLDTIVHIVHMSVKSFRVTQTHKMFPLKYVVLDVISLLPLILLYHILPKDAFYHNQYDLSAIFQINQFIRIYRIPLTMEYLDGTFIFNPMLLYFIEILCFVGICILFQSFIWLQILGRWYGNTLSWLLYVLNLIHHEDSLSWLLISITTVLTMICRYFEGVIQLTNTAERVIAFITWFSGMVMEYGVIFGGLLPSLYFRHKLRYDHLEMVEYLEHDLEVRGVTSSTVERTRTYYQELWKRAKGIKIGKLFETLPLSFRKEIMLDSFWDAFKHSNLLSGHPSAVKRSLCMIMEHEYYLPGEYLFRAGTMKDKMVYIVRGVVDVLAVEDECTAVASFSAGTCMSEASIAYQYKGANTIRCATFCMVQILHTWDALPVLHAYPRSTAEIAEVIMQRIHFASELRHNAEALRPKALDPLDEHAILLGEIKWVKDHWRKIFEMGASYSRHRRTTKQPQMLHLPSAASAESSIQQSTWVGESGSSKSTLSASKSTSRDQPVGRSPSDRDPPPEIQADYEDYLSRFAHTCAFFDLFALTDESQKTEEDLVCARVNFPWILKPESDFTSVWEIILILVVVFECYIIPYYLSFHQTFPGWVLGWGALSDAVVLVDLIIVIHTAVPGVRVALFAIIVYRLQTICFYLKILATLPWHWLAIALNANEYDAWRLRFIRMIWMVKMIKWFNKWAPKAGEFIYSFKYLLSFVTIIYWMTCVHHLFNCYYNLCEEQSWYYVETAKQVDSEEYENDLESKVLTVLLYVSSIMLRVPFIWTTARSFADVILQNLLLILSITMKCYFLAEFCGLLMLRDSSKRRFKNLLNKIDYYHEHQYRLPPMTFQQLKLFLKFQWQNNPVFDVWGDKHLKTLPRYLLKDIQETAREIVREIPLFASASSELVEELAKMVTFFHCPKSMELVRAGEHAASVYVLRRGLCQAVSHWRSDVERNIHWTLTTGDCFPFMEVMHGIPSVLTVLTETACVVAMIEVHNLQSVLKKFPAELRLVYSVVQEHNTIWNVAEIPMEDPTQNIELAEHEGRLRRRMLRRFMANKKRISEPSSNDTQRVVVESSSENSEDDGTKYEEETTEYERVWKEHRCGRFLRLFLRPVSFDPSREFVFTWEMVRMSLAIIACLLHPCAYSALINSVTTRCICYILDIYGLVDLYVRLQIGYYNADGVLITHPALTSTYYLKNSFFADLISCLPLELMPIEYLFTVRNFTMLRYYIRLLRCVQIYRFHEFMNHMALRLSYRFLTSGVVKFVVMLTMIINVTANAALYWNCDVKTTGQNIFYFEAVKIKCDFDTYITDTFLKMILDTPAKVYLMHLYYWLVLYASTCDGLFIFDKRGILRTVILSCFTFLCRNWLISVVTCNIRARRWQIMQSSHILKEVVTFLRREGVDEKLVHLTQEAFDYEWTRRRGFRIVDLLKKVPPLLQADLLFNRCQKTLAMVTHLQGANEFLLRELSRNVNLHLYNKGRFVFRLNDVQDYVYILERGRVEVIGAGNTSLCMLRKGALFGNLPRQRRMRQTCGILVHVNCVILSLPNDVFYGMLEKFPEILHRFDSVHEANLEYVPEEGHESTVVAPTEKKDKTGFVATRRDLLRIYASKKSMYVHGRNFANVCKGLMESGAIRSTGWNILMTFIIPPSVVISLSGTPLEKDYPLFNAIIYTCDIAYVIKIVTMIWFPYKKTDSEEGEVKAKIFLQKNLTDPFALPLDIISTIPMELITGIRWFRYNRALRVVTFIQFNAWKYDQLSASVAGRWMRTIFVAAMLVSGITSSYLIVRCDMGRYCEYVIDVNRMHKSYFNVTLDPGEMVSLAFMFTVSRFTCTSFIEPPIYTVGALVYDIFASVACHILMVFCCAYTASLVCGSRMAQCDFRFMVDRMDTRLRVMKVTEPLRRKAKKYLSNLWRDDHGYGMPPWLETCPKDLRFDLMAVMYGAHLRNDPVMGHGHEDLLLQITGYLRRNVFYPRDVIAERGDVDGCMYILVSGEVKAMVSDEFQLEAVAFKVPPGRLFGVKSGLYEGKPHEYTYRTTTISVVLTLHQDDWKFLFEFFPASRSNIFSQASSATI